MEKQSFLDTATAELWSDFEREASFPQVRPMLAHYTSIQTFEQIIVGGQFWFSNPLYMNDIEELRFGLNEGSTQFHQNAALRAACGNESNHQKMLHSFDHLINDFDSKHVLNTYVLCFSEHTAENNDGLLSMWRGYGNRGTGAAIVFDTSTLNSTPRSPLIIGKVRYGTRSERLVWMNQKINALAKVVEENAKNEDDYFYAAWAWLQRLKSFALFTKHQGFHEEREWRAVYMSDRDENQIFKGFFGHLATNRGIEPKLKLPIKPIPGLSSGEVSLEKIISKIILGPSIASTLGVNSLKQMLINTNHPQLAERVVASEIPFRPN